MWVTPVKHLKYRTRRLGAAMIVSHERNVDLYILFSKSVLSFLQEVVSQCHWMSCYSHLRLCHQFRGRVWQSLLDSRRLYNKRSTTSAVPDSETGEGVWRRTRVRLRFRNKITVTWSEWRWSLTRSSLASQRSHDPERHVTSQRNQLVDTNWLTHQRFTLCIVLPAKEGDMNSCRCCKTSLTWIYVNVASEQQNWVQKANPPCSSILSAPCQSRLLDWQWRPCHLAADDSLLANVSWQPCEFRLLLLWLNNRLLFPKVLTISY